jgi:hypothetical protein
LPAFNKKEYIMTNTKTAPAAEAKRPVHKIFVRGVTVAIWENKTKDDKIRHGVTLQKRYKTENGFGYTDSLDGSDIQNARKALDEADTWILNYARAANAAEASKAKAETATTDDNGPYIEDEIPL